MRILVTGATGQVGWELQRTLQTLGELAAFNRATLDLAKPDSIRDRVRAVAPEVIVNAGAYTAVDMAESERDLAMQVNGVAPGVLAEEAKRLGALLIHYSTDYVFDGTKQDAYTEDDATNPLSEYGKSKLTGEHAIIAEEGLHLIFRTSWVYAGRGRNFLLTVLRLANERRELRVVDDQIGAPTWCRTIAEATGQVLARLFVDGGVDRERARALSGIYNITAAGSVSWCGFARAILERTQSRRAKVMPPVHGITTAEYPLPARRPSNSMLSNEKLACTFNLRGPSWNHALDLCLADLAA